jgi:hypothetical protein
MAYTDPNLERFVTKAGDLINTAQVPLPALADALLWEVRAMVDYALRWGSPQELAQLAARSASFRMAALTW